MHKIKHYNYTDILQIYFVYYLKKVKEIGAKIIGKRLMIIFSI